MKNKYNWTKPDAWITNNNDCTWSEFQKQFPQFPFTDATFYNRKSKLIKGYKTSPSTTQRQFKSLYYAIASIPISEISEEEMKGMQRMLDLIQKHTKIKMEIVDPRQSKNIEIRQSQSR